MEAVSLALQTIESLADACPGAPTVVYSSQADATVGETCDGRRRPRLHHQPLKKRTSRAPSTVVWSRRSASASAPMARRPRRRRAATIITIFSPRAASVDNHLDEPRHDAGEDDSAKRLLACHDTRFGDVAIMMDVAVEASIAAVARHIDRDGPRQDSRLLVEAPQRGNIRLRRFPTEWRNMTPQHIEKIVELLAQTHDYVVIDTPVRSTN